MDCIKHVPKTRTMRKYNVEGKQRGHFRVGRVTFPSPETLECCYQRPSIAPLCGHIAAQNYSFLSASSLRPLLFTSLPIHALHWPYKPLRRLSQPTRVSPVLHILSSTVLMCSIWQVWSLSVLCSSAYVSCPCPSGWPADPQGSIRPGLTKGKNCIWMIGMSRRSPKPVISSGKWLIKEQSWDLISWEQFVQSLVHHGRKKASAWGSLGW